jgi:lipooligosaccharide transport system permease protein
MSAGHWRGATNLVDTNRIARFGALYAAEYRIRNMLKWWQAIVAFGIGNPLLYLTSIGIGVGSLIDKNTNGSGPDGVKYLAFIAPALLATAALQGTMEEVTFPVVHGFDWRKVFFAMHAAGLTGKQVAQGVIISAITRSIFTVSVYWVILWAFDAFSSMSALWLIPVEIYFGTCFASVMMAVSAYLKEDDGWFAIIGRFVVAPMFLFSGTFYSLSTLPLTIRWVGWISPLWHATEIGRYFSYNHPISSTMLLVHFGYMTALCIAGLLIANRKFALRLAA